MFGKETLDTWQLALKPFKFGASLHDMPFSLTCS